MIRRACMSDAAVIQTCARAAFSIYVARMGQEPAPMRADIPMHIASGEVHVATGSDGAVTGYVICRVTQGAMLLDTVAVWPTHAGQGIGRRLIAHVEAMARARALDAVTLYTNAVMTENMRLYRALGYDRTGRATQDGFDRVFYRKQLG